MQNKLREFINVQPQEQELVILMIIQSFLFGVGNNFIQTSAFTLFLEFFSPQSLPYTYIAIAFIVTGVAFIYLKLGERIPFFHLLIINVSFLILLALGFQLGLYSSAAKWVAFGLPIFFQIQVNFVNLAFWGLASRIYNVQQGKRLFGLIGSGLWIGIILTGFMMSYFVAWVGVANLLWLGALSMVLSLLSLYIILNRHGQALRSPTENSRQKRSEISASWWKNRYSGFIFALIFIWWIVFFFVDMLFYDRANVQFPDSTQLAGFIGSFLGYLGILTWSLNTFFSAPVINKFGQRVTLLILPALLFTSTAGLVLIARLNSSITLLFYMITTIKLLDLGVGFSIDRTALTVLYQPLPTNIRNRLQTVAEGIVQPIAIGVTGLMLIALKNYFNLQNNQLYIVLLVLTIIWIIIAVSLGREYPRMILKALDKRILNGNGSLILDPSIAQQLRDSLTSPHPGVVIYSLNLLESMEYPAITQIYSSLINHPSEDVRIEVLKRIEYRRISNLVPDIKSLLPAYTGLTKGQAINTIAALSSESSMRQVSMYLDDQDLAVRRGALLGMFRSGQSGGVSLAINKLATMVKADSPTDRLLAADIIGEVGFENGQNLLRDLIMDRDRDVRRAAIRSAGRLKDPDLWPVIVQALADPDLCSTAVYVLSDGGEQVSGLVTPLLFDENVIQDESKAISIAKVLGHLGTAEALAALFQNLLHPSQDVRYHVLKSLYWNEWKAGTRREQEVINQVIRLEMNELAWCTASEVDLEVEKEADHLRGALNSYGKRALERVFLALQLLYDKEVIRPAQQRLRGDEDEIQRAYAVEVLELTLSGDLRTLLTPLLRSVDSHERIVSLTPFFPQEHLDVEARVANILARSGDVSTKWLHAVALYTAGKIGLVKLAHYGEESTQSQLGLLQEAGALMLRMLDRIAPNKDVGASKLVNESFSPEKVEAYMLTTVEKVIILKTINIFENTPDHILVDVAALLEEETVTAGQTLFTKGDVGDSMYIIVSGKLKAHVDDKLFNYLEEREFFGEMALLDLEPRIASITAVEDTTLLRLDQEPFYELMESRIEVARGIICVLTRYLRLSLREQEEVELMSDL